jgi:hypothetical protein
MSLKQFIKAIFKQTRYLTEEEQTALNEVEKNAYIEQAKVLKIQKGIKRAKIDFKV